MIIRILADGLGATRLQMNMLCQRQSTGKVKSRRTKSTIKHKAKPHCKKIQLQLVDGKGEQISTLSSTNAPYPGMYSTSMWYFAGQGLCHYMQARIPLGRARMGGAELLD